MAVTRSRRACLRVATHTYQHDDCERYEQEVAHCEHQGGSKAVRDFHRPANGAADIVLRSDTISPINGQVVGAAAAAAGGSINLTGLVAAVLLRWA